ncbi:Pyruvate decarboxylase [Nitrospira tepida]|uniref:Pyruvate decarboxylase n=1 Tax=Nitrospira tepida TaxID=2973512 RepID=A0AA86N028_9BACT|nr:thiamine pyrophosphate-binding protein [Nitrospira tepida]CAI4032076.1 Pyruvate decarboxylase [Nitrospira tepida]
MSDPRTIGSLVIDRLRALGVEHVFGIPGDYVLTFYKLLEQSPLHLVGTTREDCAGFAADAYARIRGVGALCVTYCVGGLNTVNAVACAYAERSPVVVLTGSPGLSERARNPYLHHMVRDFETQKEVFEKVTVAAVVLDDPLTAARQLDHAIAALTRYRRPIYVEIPRDLVHARLPVAAPASTIAEEATDPEVLAEALGEVRSMLVSAKRPVILAGAEAGRYGLQDELVRLVERFNMPVASTLHGKSVISEDHPSYVGVYGGLIGREEVLQFVHDSDCLLILGSILSDVDVLDPQRPELASGQVIHATADRIAIKHHRYDGIEFEAFVKGLLHLQIAPFASRTLPKPERAAYLRPEPADPITLQGLFSHLDTVLEDTTIVIADVGESLFASADLRVRRRFEFLSPAYYTSMGFAVPAAVGAGFADRRLRPLVLVGDGAFQMTGTELATAVRYGQTPIVLILNNRGYSTEREILEGTFNDIHEWRYERVCELIGGGTGWCIRTHGEFVESLDRALRDPSTLYVFNILLDPTDRSAGMKRLAGRLAERLTAQRES